MKVNLDDIIFRKAITCAGYFSVHPLILRGLLWKKTHYIIRWTHSTNLTIHPNYTAMCRNGNCLWQWIKLYILKGIWLPHRWHSRKHYIVILINILKSGLIKLIGTTFFTDVRPCARNVPDHRSRIFPNDVCGPAFAPKQHSKFIDKLYFNFLRLQRFFIVLT